MFTYIDLFAGCGGLSLGLEKSGWQLKLAVEKSPMAAETFFYNLISCEQVNQTWGRDYPSLPIFEQVSKRMVVGPVSDVLGDSRVMTQLLNSDIDLLAGGPPCQGFSLAGRRNQNDARNGLAWDFLDFAQQVKPKFIVMENVLGMNAKFSKKQDASIFESLATALEYLGDAELKNSSYVVQKVAANAMHYGAAQHRPRLLLIACRKDIAEKLGLKATNQIWKSTFLEDKVDLKVPDLAPVPSRSNSGVTVREALLDFLEGSDSEYTRFLKNDVEWGLLPPGQNLMNHNFRSHSERTRAKFAMYQLIQRNGLDPIIMKDPQDLNKNLQREAALDLAKQALSFPLKSAGSLSGLNLNDFLQLLEKIKTKKHSQRVLNLGNPAPTVVTAADDLVHPVVERVLSVRELARFQGFPDSFEFRSKETTGGLKRRTEVPQYSQVGNAVSPFLSFAIGVRLKQLLEQLATS